MKKKEGETLKVIRRIFEIVYKNKVWDKTKKVLGIIFIVIGIISLFLPFLPGILLIIIGLAIYKNKSIEKYITEQIGKIKKEKKTKRFLNSKTNNIFLKKI